jgi:hypothetical protein
LSSALRLNNSNDLGSWGSARFQELSAHIYDSVGKSTYLTTLTSIWVKPAQPLADALAATTSITSLKLTIVGERFDRELSMEDQRAVETFCMNTTLTKLSLSGCNQTTNAILSRLTQHPCLTTLDLHRRIETPLSLRNLMASPHTRITTLEVRFCYGDTSFDDLLGAMSYHFIGMMWLGG